MPAAAVIPAPLAYTIIVAVKRLVVGLNTYILELFVHFSFLLETVHTNPFFIYLAENDHQQRKACAEEMRCVLPPRRRIAGSRGRRGRWI